jgi:hypothetical protein
VPIARALRDRFRSADRPCPLCHVRVDGGNAFRLLADHFRVCPVLRR